MTRQIASQADWAALRAEGLTVMEAAARMNCGRQTASRWMRRVGGALVNGRSRGVPPHGAGAANPAWWADPANNPLAALSPAERADYDVLKRRGGKSRAEALAAIGRADLAGGAQS